MLPGKLKSYNSVCIVKYMTPAGNVNRRKFFLLLTNVFLICDSFRFNMCAQDVTKPLVKKNTVYQWARAQ